MSEITECSEIEQFLAWLTVERGRSPRTITGYRSDLHAYVSWLETQSKALGDATVNDIDGYLNELRRQELAGASIARKRSAIRGLHRFLLDEELADDDPASNAAEAPIASRLPKALAQSDIEGLLDGVNGEDPLSRRDRALLELLYGTGARVSELTSLDLDDLAFDDGLLRLLGKGDKERLVPIGRSAQRSLASWLEPGGRPLLVAGAGRTEQRALFLNQRGGRLSRQGAHLVVSSRARRAGIHGHVSPHMLRHSCATHMLAHGADVRVVQELLGHASVATTQIYTKITAEHLRSAYEAAHPRASRS